MPKLKKEEGLPLVADKELVAGLQEKNATISQLNRFIDELRKELVFSRVANSNAAKELRILSEQLSGKNLELDDLRSHISRRDEADQLIQKELNRQLEVKDQEVRRLRRLIEQKGFGEQRRIGAFKAVGEKNELVVSAPEIRVVKSPRFEALVHELREANEQLKAKDGELQALRKQLAVGNAHVGVSRKADDITPRLVKKERQYDQMYGELTAKLKEQDRELVWLRQKLALKDRMMSSSEEALAKKIAEKEEEIDFLRQQVVDNEASHRKIVDELQDSVDAKEQLIDRLKAFVLEKKELQAKAVHVLRQQLAEMEEQAEQLKREYAEREAKTVKFVQTAETASAKLLVKENAIKRLSSRLELVEAQNFALQKQVEQLRTKRAPKLDLKAIFDANNRKHEERIKELIKQYTAREIEHKTEIENLNAKIIEQRELLVQRQEKIDSAISEFALNAERLLGMREGEQPVISVVSKKEAEQLKQKQELLDAKEKKVTELLGEVRRRAEDIKSREAAVIASENALSTKEALLLKEQEALDKEFDILEKAGFELKRSRDYLLNKKEEIELAEQRTKVPVAEQPASPVEIKALLKLPELKPPEKLVERSVNITEVARLPVVVRKEEPEPKPKVKAVAEPQVKPAQRLTVMRVKPAKVSIPKKEAELLRPARQLKTDKQKYVEEAEKMFSGSREGYSAVDEIVSLVEIALAHGETKEQIASSLQASGYKKEDIEKAFEHAATK